MPRPIDGAVRELVEAIHTALDLDPHSYPTYRDYLEDHRDRASWVLAAVTTALDPDRPRVVEAVKELTEHAPRGEHNRQREEGDD